MSVKMILQGGPLDGEEQLVQALNTDTGALLFINLPNYQHFHTDGTTVVQLGITVEYMLTGPGPAPVLGDTWDSSWIYGFVAETYTPPPVVVDVPPITLPPSVPPAPGVFAEVILSGDSTLTLDGVASTAVFMSGETDLVADGQVERVVFGDVAMVGATTLTVHEDESIITVIMVGETSLTPEAGATI